MRDTLSIYHLLFHLDGQLKFSIVVQFPKLRYVLLLISSLDLDNVD